MLRRLRSHVSGNLVGYIALLIAVTGSGSYALGAGGGSNGEIDACYVTHGKHRGDVRILVSGKCRRNETAISWSRGGPAGAPGGAGPQGAPGAQGASGAQGERGPVGPADGPAGGDLTGNFPNPELKPGSIGADEVAPDALGGDDIDESTLTG